MLKLVVSIFLSEYLKSPIIEHGVDKTIMLQSLKRYSSECLGFRRCQYIVIKIIHVLNCSSFMFLLYLIVIAFNYNSDKQLIPSFELSVEIFCVPTCFHMRIVSIIVSVYMSVHTPNKKITLPSSISVLH